MKENYYFLNLREKLFKILGFSDKRTILFLLLIQNFNIEINL